MQVCPEVEHCLHALGQLKPLSTDALAGLGLALFQ